MSDACSRLSGDHPAFVRGAGHATRSTHPPTSSSQPAWPAVVSRGWPGERRGHGGRSAELAREANGISGGKGKQHAVAPWGWRTVRTCPYLNHGLEEPATRPAMGSAPGSRNGMSRWTSFAHGVTRQQLMLPGGTHERHAEPRADSNPAPRQCRAGRRRRRGYSAM